MGYLYDESHNDSIVRFLSDFWVPDIPSPVYICALDDLTISKTKFFVTHIWYIEYYKLNLYNVIYHELLEMWCNCSNTSLMTKFDAIIIPPRHCGMRVKDLNIFFKRLFDIKRACDDAHIKIPEYLEHEPINTYDVVSDWKSSMREAICASLGLPTPSTSRIYVPITYGRDLIVRDNVRLVIDILMNFNYRRWKYKDIKAWNLRWEDGELMFYQGSMIYGYMQKCIAVRNW